MVLATDTQLFDAEIGPDGALYITVGSTCNSCDEFDATPEAATTLRAQPDGTSRGGVVYRVTRR